MKKLQLKVDDLSVESFPTAESKAEEGTVRGYDSTTGDQRICDCTDYANPCLSDGCGSADCTVGCGATGSGCTWEVTCATGSQRLCEC
jgi:hypothetical protein